MESSGHTRDTEAGATRVLCVGDVPDVSGEIEAALAGRTESADVTSVATATEGLDALERGPASCVVSASSLPDADALTFIDGVRAIAHDVPIVVVGGTADADPDPATDSGRNSDHNPDLASEVLAREATEYVHWRDERYQRRQLVRRVERSVARVRARRTARRTSAYFDALVNQAPDAILTVDASNEIVFANRTVEEVLGYAPEELVGERLTTLIPERLREDHREAFDRYRRTGVRTLDWDYVEVPGRHRDGHEVPLALSFRELTYDGRRLFTAIVRDVTGRKRREVELEASREKFEKLIETAPDAVFIVDSESGLVIETNRAAEQLLGKPREEIVGMHQSELHPPEEADRYRRIFEEHVESGGVFRDDDDYYVVRDDGHRVPVEISAGVTEIGGRTINQAVFRDITDRKRREETLATLREVTRDLMSAESKQDICDLAVSTARDILDLPISGIHLYDEDEQRLRPAAITTDAEELFGEIPTFEEGEGLAWQVYRSGDPELYDSVSERTETYNPETPVQTEMILPLGEHGVLTSGAESGERITEAKLDLAKILAANTEAALDRADRKRTIERQRDRLQAELDEVFERIDDGFLALDDEWRLVYVNERAERLLDGTEGELLGEVVWESVPGIRDADVGEALRRSVETQDPAFHEEYVEPLGAWFEFHAYPSESGLSVYFRDISERKERERRLERQNQRLESFASMLAHELRNPLSIAQIYLGSAESGDESAFEQVESALDRIEDMIDVLLVMTRGGEATLDTEPVSLREAATEAWANVDADSGRLEVETDPVVAAEPHHLQHLLRNLFANAVEHSSTSDQPSADDAVEHAGDVTVRVGRLETGFYVEDDGQGIPTEDRERVFEAGYTTDTGGIGLGLTFIAQLAEIYGWECRLTESADGGARFEFRDVTSS